MKKILIASIGLLSFACDYGKKDKLKYIFKNETSNTIDVYQNPDSSIQKSIVLSTGEEKTIYETSFSQNKKPTINYIIGGDSATIKRDGEYQFSQNINNSTNTKSIFNTTTYQKEITQEKNYDQTIYIYSFEEKDFKIE